MVPTPGLTGNDTGGIITYSPDLELAAYHEIAANWCARWGRISHLTSVHRRYGDYVAFICIDHPGHHPLIGGFSSPIADKGLNERQRRDRGGVGAEDARAEGQTNHVRQPQQGRALVLGKATFRSDQYRKR